MKLQNHQSVRLQEKENGIIHLILDAPNQTVNIMDASYRQAMDAVISELKNKENIAGIIIRSEKKTFFAGGDLNELIQVTPENAKEFNHQVNSLKQNLRDLETLGVPVVAAINGTALGGGLEIALACHYRICISDKNIRLGLPEVKLGLLPGGGGIIRMVRYFGIEKALPYLLEGKKVGPLEAMDIGLINDIAATNEELISKAEKWIKENPNVCQPWDMKGYRLPGGNVNSAKLAHKLAIMPALARQKTAACYPAADAIIAVAVEGAQVHFDAAQLIETRYFVELASGQISKNMINTFWFQLNTINAGLARPKDLPKHTTKRVGIIGAGMMGAGIAYATAKAGIEVVLKDITIQAAEKGKDYSVHLLDKKIKRGQITVSERDHILGLIKTTTQVSDFSNCDLIIEAVFEDKELKAQVTHEASLAAQAEAVISSNTSTLPITELSNAVDEPNRFIGLHFFSPVDKMNLVEIIKGKLTNDETLAKAFDYVLQIKKTPIVVNDSRGFYTSRVFSTYTQEAMAMIDEGIHPAMIENGAKLAGFPVSPLAVTDEVSLTLMQHIRDQVKADYEAQKQDYKQHRSFTVIDKMVNTFGRRGKAAGAGFYEYTTASTGKKEKYLWPGLMEHFYQPERQISVEDIRDRLLFVQAIETAKAMQEGIINTVADANIGSIFGIGFPPWTGGTLQFINHFGLSQFLDRANALADRYGEQFRPPKLIQKKVLVNEIF